MMHKTKLFLLCGACLALAGTRRAWAEPFDESKGVMFYARSQSVSLKKPIVPPSRELPVDEAIIALANSSNANFIADATEIPIGARVAPFPATPVAREHKWSPQFYSVFEDMQEAAQLSTLRYDDTTYLIWKRPDVLETARALSAAGQLRPTHALPEQFGLYRVLNDLRHSPAWPQRLSL